MVAEEVIVAPRSKCDVPCLTQYRDLLSTAGAWITETGEVMPGVHLARVVLGVDANRSCVRIINLNKEHATLAPNLWLGELHPVQISPANGYVARGSTEEITPVVESLIKGVSEEVSDELKKRLRGLLLEYGDILSTSERDIGRTTVCEHRIDTGASHPVRQPLRRQPLPYRNSIDQHLDQMLDTGVIEPAVSEWAANVVLAKKKDGSLLFCIDYRQFSDRTRKDSYPLPRIDECLDALTGSGWFSTLGGT